MIDRPLDPDQGQRVEVRRFELTGARDLPDNDITVAAIEAILEKARADRPEGFTVGQLQQVADRITNYYRERGLILAQAVVPVQEVEQGVVEIAVIEGRLGRIRPQGNELYSQDTIEGAFDGLIGEPVSQGQTESALLTLTDYPGLVAFGVFEPGQAVGEADLVLQVQNEERFEGRVHVDNHGTRNTGRGRARAEVSWNNVTGNADRLTVGVLGSFDPANSAYGSIAYQRRFGRYYQMDAFFRSNRFDVGGDLEEFDISGETDKIGINATRTWIRSREMNFSSGIGLTAKRSRTLREGEQDNEDRLTVVTLRSRFDSVDARFGGLNFGGFDINQGLDDVLGSMGDADSAAEAPRREQPSRRGSDGFAEGEFTSLFAYYSRLQNIIPGQSLLLRTELQYSSDLLVPMQQYSIGGPNNVRAFPSSHALVDSGALISAEYVMQMDWLGDVSFLGENLRDGLRATVFYDYATGQLNDPRANEPDGTVSFSGFGAGLRFEVPGTLDSRLQIAWDIEGNEEIADPEAVRSPQVWLDLTWRF